MCLKSVDSVKPRSWGNGWKIFRSFQPNVLSGHMYHHQHNSLDFNIKLTAKEDTINDYGLKYKSGYHIFIHKKDAIRWKNMHGGVVYRVRYSQAHTLGIDLSRGKTIIAKHIRVLKNE